MPQSTWQTSYPPLLTLKESERRYAKFHVHQMFLNKLQFKQDTNNGPERERVHAVRFFMNIHAVSFLMNIYALS